MCRQQLHAVPGVQLQQGVYNYLSVCMCVRYIFKPTTKRKRIDNEGNGLKP